MIATLTAQSLATPPMSRSFSRNTNQAGGPLPLIPRRISATRTVSATPSPSSATNSVALSTSASMPIATSTASSSSLPRRPESPTSDSNRQSDSSSSSDNYLSIRPKRVRGLRNNPHLRASERSTSPPAKSDSSRGDTRTSSDKTPRPDDKQKNEENDTPRPRASMSMPSAFSAQATSPVSPKSPLVYTPGSLKLSLAGLKPRTFSETALNEFGEIGLQASLSAPLESARKHPSLLRKKSGEPVRSSLKGSRPKIRGSLSVVTGGTSITKSEPASPSSSRTVHFDSQEHVKLFLAEQKPLAVSRDGSPTEDTSGTDNDFPSWIYGDGPARSKMRLTMQVNNMPPLIDQRADVTLEELKLSPDSTNILGKVRLRNLSYNKWVAVRFTFDAWQTTSEVSGKYAEAINPEFDRFSFIIKLNDLMSRIEGKTLQLAVRYSIEGREMWDNNRGLNYVASFTKAKPRLFRPPEDDDVEVDSPVAANMPEIRAKLEKVAQRQEMNSLSFLQPLPRRSSTPPAATELTPSITSPNLSSRYDFGASLKDSSWRSPDFTIRRHERTRSHPVPSPSTSPAKRGADSRSSSIPFPEMDENPAPGPTKTSPAIGSPRDLFEGFDSSSPRSVLSPISPRNHQRGYFDLKSPMASAVAIKRTPPGTPLTLPLDDTTPLSSPRHNSFPPLSPVSPGSQIHSAPVFGTTEFRLNLQPPMPTRLQRDGSGSELSTPSIVSPSSSSSRESSPSPPESLIASPAHEMNYSQLINKFCFFTGGGDDTNLLGVVPRCNSASGVESLLSSHSPLTPVFPRAGGMNSLPMPPSPVTHQRSNSADSIPTISSPTALRSGNTTPTTPKLVKFPDSFGTPRAAAEV